MELIAAVLLAGPLGYFARRGLRYYLIAWAVIFPVQTVVVFGEGDGAWSYWVINAVILALGIGLNRIGHRLASKDQVLALMRTNPLSRDHRRHEHRRRKGARRPLDPHHGQRHA